jgi:hypothetical protein
VWVKVNAAVDDGIAALVTALSRIAGLQTLESCQGGDGHNAVVFFRLGGWRECGAFVFERLMPRMSPDLRSEVRLAIDAYDSDVAQASITLEPAAIPALTRIVEQLAAAVGPGAFVAGNTHRDAVAEIVAASGSD